MLQCQLSGRGRRLAAAQQVDHAAAQARREALLPWHFLQGQLVPRDPVLPLPRDAPRVHRQSGGERQAGEAHQGLRSGPRAFLDVRDGPGGGGDVLLDGHRAADYLHQLEYGGAQQLPVRERRGGALPRTLEPRREGPQVERLALLLRDVLRVRGVSSETDVTSRQGQGHALLRERCGCGRLQPNNERGEREREGERERDRGPDSLSSPEEGLILSKNVSFRYKWYVQFFFLNSLGDVFLGIRTLKVIAIFTNTVHGDINNTSDVFTALALRIRKFCFG